MHLAFRALPLRGAKRIDLVLGGARAGAVVPAVAHAARNPQLIPVGCLAPLRPAQRARVRRGRSRRASGRASRLLLLL